jgi:hypothetical protein
MLDTKTLTEETIKECRENEAWLKTKVEEFAPEGTTCQVEELSVNDTDGDEYIFCEVTITCNKRKHHFNYYAGTQGVTLVERIGGKKGEIADGDKLGKTFEMEFYVPSKDDMEDMEEFLKNLADYAPKKPKAKKVKITIPEKVFLVTAAYQKDGGDLDYTSNIGVYKSKEGATKALIEVAIENLPNYDCERAIIGYNHDDYMWGEWDTLAVTADKKGDPEDDDYYDLSQEEILELIRKAGRVFVETETHSGMELKIVETDLEP